MVAIAPKGPFFPFAAGRSDRPSRSAEPLASKSRYEGPWICALPGPLSRLIPYEAPRDHDGTCASKEVRDALDDDEAVEMAP
jgi:hypothetical protein